MDYKEKIKDGLNKFEEDDFISSKEIFKEIIQNKKNEFLENKLDLEDYIKKDIYFEDQIELED